jgi:hypothetical protein
MVDVGGFLKRLLGTDDEEEDVGFRPPPRPGFSLPGVIDETGAMGQPEGVSATGDPISVVGDGWKPRKVTTLGKIADALIEMSGDEPIFAKERQEQNLNAAMQGFQGNPEQAIRRLSRIPGMEKLAWDMYDKYQDNKRADMAAEPLAATRQERLLTPIGGMLNAIRRAKDPAAAYAANLPRMRAYLAARKVGPDVLDLPDVYDPDALDMEVNRFVSPEKQLQMEALEQYRANRLNLDTRKADDMAAYRSERLEDFDIQEQGRDARAANSEAGKAQRAADALAAKPKAGKAGQRLVDTPMGPAILKPDGTIIVRKDGKLKAYMKRKSVNGVSQYVKVAEKDE